MLLGKRYKCGQCQTEVMVTRPGAGEPVCCGIAMILKKPKETKSAD
jgi:desulfoferrodoxin